MTEPETQAQEPGRWYALLLYTTTLFTVGFLAGHLITLCPTTGLRAASYSWTMYVSYALLIVFALAMFIAIGYRMKGRTNDD